MNFSKIKTKLNAIGFFHVFGSDVINKMAMALGNILIVRIISKPEYGMYTYANNLYTFVLLLSGLGVTSSALILLSDIEEKEIFNKLYNFAIRIGIGFNAVLALVLLLMGIFVPFSIKGANILLIGMSLLPVLYIILDLQRIYLRAKLLNKEFALLNNIVTISQVVLMCMLAFVLKEWSIILAQYIAFLLGILIIQKRNKIQYSLKKIQGLKKQKVELIKMGIILMVNSGLFQLMYLLDILLLGIMCKDATIVAAYKVATTIPTTLIFIPTTVVTCVMPYFGKNRKNKEWLCKNFRAMILGVGAVNMFFSLCCLIFAKQIIYICFGKAYVDVVYIFRILIIYFFFNGTFRITAVNLLAMQRRMKMSFFNALITGLLNVVLNIVFITKYGSSGAAYATLITGTVSGIICTSYYWYYIHRKNLN